MPSFLTFALATAAAILPTVHAWDHYVTVGQNGNHYNPEFIHANVGDVVKLQFFPQSHTVTQTSFESPCDAKGTPFQYGIKSGFVPVADAYSTKWFEFEVKDDKPMWFYCGQANHCETDGMVFAVNPPASGDKTFDAFKHLALSTPPQAANTSAYAHETTTANYDHGYTTTAAYSAPPYEASSSSSNQGYTATTAYSAPYGAPTNSNHQEHQVTVGQGGNKYNPEFIHAQVGDIVKLQFFPMNHTLTQTSFDSPCDAKDFKDGVKSGFIPVADAYNTKYFEFEVKDDKPMWFYCGQADHCEADGMVFAVNPPASGNTFDAFKKHALATPVAPPSEPTGQCPIDSNAGELLDETLEQSSTVACKYEKTTCRYLVNGSFDSGSSDCPFSIEAAKSAAGAVLAGAASDSSSGGDSTDWSKYIPIFLGLLAGNLVLTFILLAVNALGYCRRGREVGGRSRQYTPVRAVDGDRIFSAGPSYTDEDRKYSQQ